KQRDKINEFLEEDYRKDFAETQERVEAELELYERANDIAQTVNDHRDNPMAAWRVYEQARDAYEWAEGVNEARGAVISWMSGDLRRLITTARAAYEERNMAQIEQLSREVENAYADKQDVVLDGLLDEMRIIQQNVHDFEDKLREAQDALEDIANLVESDPRKAADQLRSLRRRHEQAVLERLEDLPDVQERVAARGDAEAKLDTLESFMTSDSPARVRAGVDLARANARQYPDDERFEQMQETLMLHERFLEAQRRQRSRKHREALGNYEQVASHPDHPDAAEAEMQAERIRDMLAKEVENTNEIDLAERMLESDPAEAYFTLVRLDIANQDLSRKRNNMVAKAKQRAVAEADRILSRLEVDVRRWDSADPVDVDTEQSQDAVRTIQEQLKLIKDLGSSDKFAKWSDTFHAYLLAQEARLLQSGASIGEETHQQIQEKWLAAVNSARGDQRTRYEHQLKQARKNFARARLNQARTDAIQRNTDTDEIQKLIEHVRHELEQLSAQYSDDVEILLWRAELAKIGGQYSYNPSRRRGYFEQMANLAELATQNAKTAAHRSEATQLGQQAQDGLEIAIVMDDIQREFDADTPQSLHSAREKWDTIANRSSGLTVIRSWWDNLKREKISRLNESVRTDATSMDINELRPLAMLLMLDENHPRGRQMLGDLDKHWDRVTEEARQILNDTESATRANGNTIADIFKDQQRQIRQMRNNLEVMTDLVRLFPNRTDLGDVSYDAAELRNQLDESSQNLSRFEKQISAIATDMQLEKKDSDLSSSKEQLSEIDRGYREHKAYKIVYSDYEKAAAKLAELNQVIETVRTYIVEEEAYNQAHYVLSRYSIEDFKEYGLQDEFDIVEPVQNRTYMSYSEVLELAKSRQGTLGLILNFAAKVDLKGANGIAPLIDDSHSYDWNGRRDYAVNWQAEKERALSYIRSGDFDAARQVAQAALEAPTIRREIGLAAVVEHLHQPPYVEAVTEQEREAATTPYERYTLAIEHAGTMDGAGILQDIRDRVLPAYEEQLQDAQAMLVAEARSGSISEMQDAFENQWQQWQNAVVRIGTAMSSPHMETRRRTHNGDLRRAARAAYEAYEECRKIAATHPRLTEMRRLWLWKEAARRTNTEHPEPEGGLE
ncbi:MAG: hypothetical protein AAF787_11695, partial [Chloroflexota bacterium]